MVVIDNVFKKYLGYTAVNGLTLNIGEGEVLALVGPNGAGKTTIISMIIGLLDPSEGEIHINGELVRDDSINIKRQIGYVSDNSNKFLYLKPIEYLNFVADMYGISESKREEKILSLCRRFDIEDKLDVRMDKFSKGMKQKIMIIGSLLHEPKIWILDEPFTGLDPKIAYELKKYIKEYAERGNTVILSSHNLDVIEDLCSDILLIKKGNILYSGSFENLMSKFRKDATLEEIYMEVFENERISSFNKN